MSAEYETPILVEGLSYWYGHGETRLQALFEIDVSAKRGTLSVLRGPSGCGKTTLLTLLGGLRAVGDGSVRLLGHELNGAPSALQEDLRRNVGFIFQAHNLHPSLTARQNVMMSLQVHGKPGHRNERRLRAVDHALGILGLGDRLDYLPEQLSGGQKQRVAIARALVSNPTVVLADEPTAALDSASGLQAVRILRDLGRERGTTTLMVTHDDRIIALADRIIDMKDGRIVREVASGSSN